MKYRTGDRLEYKKWGGAEIVKIVDEYEIHIKFDKTGFVWVTKESFVYSDTRVKDLIQIAQRNRGYISKPARKNYDMVGSVYKTNKWGEIEILEYVGCSKFLVKFKDSGNLVETYKNSILSGRVADKARQQELKRKTLQKYSDVIVESDVRLDWPQRDGGTLEVLEFCKDSLEVVLQNDVGVTNKVPFVQYKAGAINTETVELLDEFKLSSGRFRFGIKDAEVLDKTAYRKWSRIINSCYNTNVLLTQPYYLNVTIAEEWRYFSNFQEWFLANYKEGAVIEKDLLSPLEAKAYSPDTCVFVSGVLNSELSLHKTNYKKTGFVGVYLSDNGTFCARIKDASGNKITIGTYPTPEQAHKAWQYKKADILEEKLSRGVYKTYDFDIVKQIICKLRLDADNGVVTDKLSI